MKKLFILLGIALMLMGCTHQYVLKENWIDDDDIQYVLKHPDVQDWVRSFGEPVITEYHQDTVEFIYNREFNLSTQQYVELV